MLTAISLVAMQAGGYNHPWDSAYVLCTMIIGIALIVAFVVWEAKYAKVPMVPREMFSGQRIVAMAYGIAFVAGKGPNPSIGLPLLTSPIGMNFYALLNFFPLLFSDVFPPDPVQVGLKGLAPGLSTTLGAVFVNAALSWFKGHNRELLIFSTVIMSTYSIPSHIVENSFSPRSSCFRRCPCMCNSRNPKDSRWSWHHRWLWCGWCPRTSSNCRNYRDPRYDYRNMRRALPLYSYCRRLDRLRSILQRLHQQAHPSPPSLYWRIRRESRSSCRFR
jgi:hypothetical protein